MPAGKITTLQAQANDPQRVNLFIDGVFAIGVSLTTLARERLYVGQELTAEEYARLERAEQADRAISAALRALDARPRSIAELRDRLGRKGFDADLIELAIERLSDLGLVDDRAFARFWVEQRQHLRPRGPNALRDELRRKGVETGLIGETLSDVELVGDSVEQAEALARRALGRYAGAADYQTFARRMGGFLQRRGYQLDTIRPIVTQLWNELKASRQDIT
jgi:regulatory protein